MGWFLSRLFEHRIDTWLHNFTLLVKIIDKTTHSVQYFNLNLILVKDTLKTYFYYLIRCRILELWVGYFIYFKITPVFFQWMFFKEINRLRKEINGLLRNGKSNIYLKVTTETFSKLRFSGWKKFVTRSDFGELQLTQISLNFETSCCSLKIRDLGAKLCVPFLSF